MQRAFRAGAIAVALGVVGLGGPARAAESTAYAVDLLKDVDADAIVRLDEQIGPVVFHEALLQDHPTAEELREADADDTARPHLILIVDTLAPAVLDLTLQLEDEAGQVLVSCSGVESMGKEWKDLVEVCRRGPELKTVAWPRVKALRVLGTVKARG